MDLAADTLVVFGEVRTCLLPESSALSRGAAADLVDLVPGQLVRSRERPVSWAESPELAEGVDCRLATPQRTRVRAVGTVATRAVVVGGRMLQGSARAAVLPAARTKRRTWSHYLSRLGVVEVLRPTTGDFAAALVGGYLGDAEIRSGTFDLGSIAHRAMNRVRTDPVLNQRAPIHSGNLSLRWAARVEPGAAPRVRFVLSGDEERTADIVVGDAAELAVVQRFCEDLAMHDWLLTVLTEVIDEAEMFELSRTPVDQVLAPMLEHLVHLWMPGALTPEPLRGLWHVLEADPGFSRQWASRVGQIRDRVAVATLAALNRSRAAW